MATADTGNNIEPDNQSGDEGDETSMDGDSAFGESVSDMTDSTSIGSAIKNYRQENGRTYHSYGIKEYYGPNDEEAQENLDIAHQFYCVLMDGALVHAPIGDDVQRVLDVGTGTGIWAIDYADAHPEADVKGIDISPIQPEFVPPNLRFEVDDFNCEWYDDNKFDLIHIRELNGCIGDPPLFYRNCFMALAPGGWIDITECEMTDYYSTSNDDKAMKDLVSEDHPLYGNHETFTSACERAGLDGNIAPKIEGWLKDAGFENISVAKVKVPVGPWAKGRRQKDIGSWNLLRAQTGLVSWFMRLGTSQLGWTSAEVHVYVARIKAAIKEMHWQLWTYIYLISAQKPLEAEPTEQSHTGTPQSLQDPLDSTEQSPTGIPQSPQAPQASTEQSSTGAAQSPQTPAATTAQSSTGAPQSPQAPSAATEQSSTGAPQSPRDPSATTEQPQSSTSTPQSPRDPPATTELPPTGTPESPRDPPSAKRRKA